MLGWPKQNDKDNSATEGALTRDKNTMLNDAPLLYQITALIGLVGFFVVALIVTMMD